MIEGETGGDARENEDDDDDDDFGVPPKHVRRVKSSGRLGERFLIRERLGEEEKRYARKVLEVTNTTKEDLLPCVVSNRQVLSRKELEQRMSGGRRFC